jgi:hypothetical protein
MVYTFNSLLVRGLQDKKEYTFLKKIPPVLFNEVEKQYIKFIEDFATIYGQRPSLDIFKEKYKHFRIDHLATDIPMEYAVDTIINDRQEGYIKSQILNAQQSGQNIYEPGFLLDITKKCQPIRIDIIDYDDFDRNLHLDESARIPFGIKWFDDTFGGVHSSDYNIIFGALGNGKTNLLLYLLHKLHKTQNQNILVFSNEMAPREFIAKLDAMRLGINPKLFRNLKFTDEQRNKLVALNSETNTGPRIKVAGTISHPSQLLPILENLDTPIDVIAIDGLHLMGKGNAIDQSQKTVQLGEVSRDVRLFTLNHEIPVFAVTQGNRGAAKTDEPTPEDLGLAYSIGQDAVNMTASSAVTINGENYFKYYSSKNRNGDKASIYAKFNWDEMKVEWYNLVELEGQAGF